MPKPTRTGTPARAVRLAALLAGLEGLGLVGLAVFFVVELVVATPSDAGTALATTVFELLGGAVLLGVAHGLRRARRWARSPSVALQIVFLPVGYTLAFQAGQPEWGVPVLVLAVGELYLLFTPEARAALGHSRPP